MSIDGDEANLTIGVLGTGAMGRGIIQVAAVGGLQVIAYDAKPGAAEEAKAFVEKMLKRSVEKGRMSSEETTAAVARINVGSALSDLAPCDVVVEAVSEKLDLKQQLFSDIEEVVRDDTILASNTSSLSITAIAAATKRPERVAGFHFFNPVPLMKLVEVIGGLRTSPPVISALVKLGRRMGREPVECSDTPGFLVNHIGRGFMPEALRIVDEGIASPADIDKILCEGAEFRMGPFALLDLVGVDVAHPVMESIYNQFYQEPMYKPFTQMRQRLNGGILGRKSGKGFYEYEQGKRVEVPDTPVAAEMPPCVWVDNHDPESASILRAILKQQSVTLEEGDRPSQDALCLVTPIGEDATTSALTRDLDPSRTVAVDTLLGFEGRRTLMPTPLTSQRYCDAARSLLGTDVPATLIKDAPGFVTQRVVAMIVNVGCAIAQRGIAAPEDIDLGARLGLNYPQGPLELGDKVGPARILHILEQLEQFYGEPRYRPSPWLKHRARLGMSLRQQQTWASCHA